ncbi:phage terminase small subunit P27 family [Paracoccus sp. (in: a-proteobacteria)]|uniref:phage terminase small subunit P27 family n=1 Tax=Paracoccus sp. TaxID=267 RepID=UPI0028AEE224|nr:phage terminase small subunit P27 family [Paracoccus sp. (in: a-proteobacteria)]
MRGAKPNIKTDLDAIKDMPPPDWLSGDAAAEWTRILPMLAQRRILTEADLGTFENYCVAQGTVREMEREIRKAGPIQKVYKIDKEGNSVLVSVRKNPAVAMQSDAMTRARLLAAELGCTPVSRSRPTVEDNEGNDDLFTAGLLG